MIKTYLWCQRASMTLQKTRKRAFIIPSPTNVQLLMGLLCGVFSLKRWWRIHPCEGSKDVAYSHTLREQHLERSLTVPLCLFKTLADTYCIGLIIARGCDPRSHHTHPFTLTTVRTARRRLGPHRRRVRENLQARASYTMVLSTLFI